MPSQLSNKNLIWLDLEMTGLDPEHERIIEIATIITDSELNIIAEGPNLVINQNKSPMCGNTVSHDRRFLSKYMPQLEAYFNYRHIDVSSVKEVITRWSNNAQAYEKNSCHRAQDDIRESINELRFYKKEFFRI